MQDWKQSDSRMTKYHHSWLTLCPKYHICFSATPDIIIGLFMVASPADMSKKRGVSSHSLFHCVGKQFPVNAPGDLYPDFIGRDGTALWWLVTDKEKPSTIISKLIVIQLQGIGKEIIFLEFMK